MLFLMCWLFFFKHKTAYEMRMRDWSSDVCSSDLPACGGPPGKRLQRATILDDDAARLLAIGAWDGPARHGTVDEAEHLRRPDLLRGLYLSGGRPAGYDVVRRQGCEVSPDRRNLHQHADRRRAEHPRSEEHTSELQSLMRISYAVFCLKQKQNTNQHHTTRQQHE